MEQGAKIDPVTLEPQMRQASQYQQERAKAEEARLAAKVADLSLAHSADGQRVIALIEAHLEKRIMELVAGDAQAQAYKHLLEDMGHKVMEAQRAVRTLAKRQLRRADLE
jgi:hypothetical protein